MKDLRYNEGIAMQDSSCLFVAKHLSLITTHLRDLRALAA